MAISSLLKDALAAPLRTLGFVKKSNNWYLETEETILVVNLQKSQYGEQYYVNCGVTLKSFGGDPFPKEHLCDIRFRLSSVVPSEKHEECERALNLENNIFSEEERKIAVTKLFELYGLSLLLDCKSIASAASAYKTGRLPDWTVSKKIADLMSAMKREPA